MKATLTARNLTGLGARLAARYLPAAQRAAASEAARALADAVAAGTGVAPEVAGTPDRPVVRIADAAVRARVTGSATQEAEPLLDAARLGFARTHSSARRRP